MRSIEKSPYSHAVIGYLSNVGMFLHGYLHWIAMKRSDSLYVIVHFDLSSERFSEVPTHAYIDEFTYLFYCLMVLNGYLCMVVYLDKDEAKIDVMIMREYGVQSSWGRLVVLNVEVFSLLKPVHQLGDNEIVVFDENRDPDI
ncbi:hypothetical protein LIER_16225 [Lithospermum erythrorhizon]|uniref:F-box associated beta-propeller type 1 domain-containing protein n=1 Tax=Lithospermum erythrorhizon TaxID=34254 RepID=A0AAV3Q920_LITER